jgi:hypothetical protein
MPWTDLDRVRKFQRTADNGSRLRKTSATNAMSAMRPPPVNNNPALRGRNKAPLGPRERPQDFSRPRWVNQKWCTWQECGMLMAMQSREWDQRGFRRGTLLPAHPDE